MSEMVDRVMKALFECQSGQSMAVAAIEAMRKPTEAMVIAGCRHENMGDMAGRWEAMIDEALK